MIIFLLILLLIVIFLNSKIKFEINFCLGQCGVNRAHYDYNYGISIIFFKKLKTFCRDEVDLWLKNRRNRRGTLNNKNGRGKKYLEYINKYVKYFAFEKMITYVRSGLISTIPTTFAVPIISTFLAYIYSKYKIHYSKNCYFLVEPSYEKLELSVKVQSIISIKIVNIIYILFKVLSERRKKNGGTSNRRSYEYCYE